MHPHLTKLTDLTFQADLPPDEAGELRRHLPGPAARRGAWRACPALLAAGGTGGPHGDGPVMFDLSGDFRIKDAGVFKQYYGLEHTAPDWAARRPPTG